MEYYYHTFPRIWQTVGGRKSYTLLTQIKTCINSRQPTIISSKSNDFSLITPGHFLVGSVLTVMTLKISTCTSFAAPLATLEQGRSSEDKRGDLVLLKDDNLLPLQWTLARIGGLHPSADCKAATGTSTGIKYYEKDSLVADPDYGSILSSLLVGGFHLREAIGQRWREREIGRERERERERERAREREQEVPDQCRPSGGDVKYSFHRRGVEPSSTPYTVRKDTHSGGTKMDDIPTPASSKYRVRLDGSTDGVGTSEQWGRGGGAVSLLASHQGELRSIPGWVTPDFRNWESCQTMPLVGGFSQGSMSANILLNQLVYKKTQFLYVTSGENQPAEQSVRYYLTGSDSCLSVGPCALDYSKTKTQDHFLTDPSADELVQRNRISSGHTTPPSCRRPVVG
ncbi:hypothetical protein PR048_011415, partial [Dryococelus australis]